MYDITRKGSFENIPLWIKEALQRSGNDFLPLILLGNKSDMRDKVSGSLTPKHGLALAKEISRIPRKNPLQCKFLETSAKTGENVEKAFNEMTRLILG